jgi:serine/threonine-protein kinase RsbW
MSPSQTASEQIEQLIRSVHATIAHGQQVLEEMREALADLRQRPRERASGNKGCGKASERGEQLEGAAMFHRKGSVCRQELVPHQGDIAPWERITVQSVADMEQVIQTITTAAMATAGFCEKETLRLRLALDEAMVNAHKHGNQGDWTKPIKLRYHLNENGVVAEIEDQGLGFDPTQVPDPLAPENLQRDSGRGLFLMRAYMSNVCHNAEGNCICLCKRCPGNRRLSPSPVLCRGGPTHCLPEEAR